MRPSRIAAGRRGRTLSPRTVPPELLSELIVENDQRIILLVIDGLGGLPSPTTGLTELETARTPHLDALAARSTCGLSEPVGAGITPGSGPGHLALFGYDPIASLVGRGILSALGIDFPLEASDVAARINFATLDDRGNVSDRRAGRISTEENRRLVDRLRLVQVPGLEVFLETESEHRAMAVFRAEGLSDHLGDTDPQQTGVPAHRITAIDGGAEATARLLNHWVAVVHEALRDERPANGLLLRGFARRPALPTFQERYGLTAASIAIYPMYRGMSRLVGMSVLDSGPTLPAQIEVARRSWSEFTYFYIHVKAPDAAGEDGDFERRVHLFESIDSTIPALLDLGADCLMITGDHSTPAVLRQHSWHPVPFLLHARHAFADRCQAFGERACTEGSLGTFPAQAAMQLALAATGKLAKYGA
ncbi:MAG: 2,3-bisphosphoglycerate-independent phosphoglycerate mutase [Chloroflexi bacterium]|nr:2,3-bisphosphoglycerate-independent phosphoglycerate mutase [Chloroflexota bacterium]